MSAVWRKPVAFRMPSRPESDWVNGRGFDVNRVAQTSQTSHGAPCRTASHSRKENTRRAIRGTALREWVGAPAASMETNRLREITSSFTKTKEEGHMCMINMKLNSCNVLTMNNQECQTASENRFYFSITPNLSFLSTQRTEKTVFIYIGVFLTSAQKTKHC